MATPLDWALILGAVASATGTGLSIAESQQQNKAMKLAAKRSRQAAELAEMQAVDQRQLDRQKEIDQSRQIEGRIKVAMGESGVSLAGGTANALLRQNLATTKENLGIINLNTSNQVRRIQSEGSAMAADYMGRTTNTLVQGITGFLGGAQTGLSIASAGDSLGLFGSRTGGGTPVQ